jgi:diguanylate cyclase (GGDEF)-like protein
MVRFKLTSPGVLLILAVLATGGIFLLDTFFLRPHIDAQKDAALQEQAGKTRRATQMALQGEQEELRRCAASLAEDLDIVRSFCNSNPASAPAGRLDEFMRDVLDRVDISHAWLTDRSGRVMASWSTVKRDQSDSHGPSPDGPAGRTEAPGAGGLPESVDIAARGAAQGLLQLPDGPAVFAQCPIPSLEQDTNCAGYLMLARPLDAARMEKFSKLSDSKVVLVSGSKLPAGVLDNNSAGLPAWLTSQEQMAVAWAAKDVSGRSIGYFLATVPVTHILRQTVTSRRMILIILSLSVGLALLVILGSHMLVTGPVVRLLERLQRLDAGEGSVQSLARNLHGEPLMLARRLENAFEKLAHISKTDQLTSLANRRHFEEVLSCFYHQARRYNRPMSLLVMDVDFFKAVNDSGGHQAGDNVLKQVAGALEEACRQADLPARFGGDEFAVLLPETAAVDAEAVAERIRQAIDRLPIRVSGTEFHVTTSIGIADLNSGEINSPCAMLGLADRALYAAKQNGRNCVVQAHNLHEDALDSRQPSEDSKINLLSKKLAGLDSRFKDLFLLAFDQVMAILEQRDPHMADHTRKVQHYATVIGQEMELAERVIKRIEIAAMMHDLGMVAMPDSILLCPGALSEEQMRIMRRHPLLSVRIMERMEFLEQEIPAVRYHHERFDGKGYPEGISGAAIPLTARILSVADAFDAMTSPRTYRTAKTVAEAIGEITRGSGTQFDPTVISAFMSAMDRLGEELMHVPGVTPGGQSTNSTHWLRAAWRESEQAEAAEAAASKSEDSTKA